MRLSNIELLRLISMFGVLTVHADFGALGWPDQADFSDAAVSTTARCFFESFAIVGVNVFVLISGWFGIRFKWKGLSNLLFQCLFFLFGIYAVCVITGQMQFGIKGIYHCLMMGERVWFVKAYIGLYLLAPVINSFIEHSDRKTFKRVLITLFVFQTIYGWISSGARFIEGGYSVFSFSLLYMLARYVRVYQPKWSQLKLSRDLLVYAGCSVFTGIMFIIGALRDSPVIISYFFVYTSPLTIVGALFVLLAFTKISLTSRIVNSIAESCLAVYLFHFILWEKYMTVYIQEISATNNSIISFIFIFALLIGFYLSAIIIDKVRLFIWRRFLLPQFCK